MIVKDEVPVIRRYLDPVWSIVDTGLRDRAQATERELLAGMLGEFQV